MSNTENNIPAFPHTYETENQTLGKYTVINEGMTLLDYFAGEALKGLLSDTNYKALKRDAADTSYAYAAAMLEARKHYIK